jgi:hypothetical protein
MLTMVDIAQAPARHHPGSPRSSKDFRVAGLLGT